MWLGRQGPGSQLAAAPWPSHTARMHSSRHICIWPSSQGPSPRPTLTYTPLARASHRPPLAVKEAGKCGLHIQVHMLTKAGTVTEDRGKLLGPGAGSMWMGSGHPLGQEAQYSVGCKVLPRSLSLFGWAE